MKKSLVTALSLALISSAAFAGCHDGSCAVRTKKEKPVKSEEMRQPRSRARKATNEGGRVRRARSEQIVEGAGEIVKAPVQAAGTVVEGVGKGTAQVIEAPVQAAGTVVEGVGEGAVDVVEGVGEGVVDVTEGVLGLGR